MGFLAVDVPTDCLPFDFDTDQAVFESAVDAVFDADPGVSDAQLHMAVDELTAASVIEDAWYDGSAYHVSITFAIDASEALRRGREWRTALRRAKTFRRPAAPRILMRSSQGASRRHRSVRRNRSSRGSPARPSEDPEPPLAPPARGAQ